MIDQLKFDQHFLSVLSLIGSTLTLVGMFIFRRFIAERSIAYVVGFLTLVGCVGAAHPRHVPRLARVDRSAHRRSSGRALHRAGRHRARIAARSDRDDPDAGLDRELRAANLKATYFAVMASFTNLALSLSQLGTKYLNQIFIVTREVRDPATARSKCPPTTASSGPCLSCRFCLASPCPSARSSSPACPNSARLTARQACDRRRLALQRVRYYNFTRFIAGKSAALLQTHSDHSRHWRECDRDRLFLQLVPGEEHSHREIIHTDRDSATAAGIHPLFIWYR